MGKDLPYRPLDEELDRYTTSPRLQGEEVKALL